VFTLGQAPPGWVDFIEGEVDVLALRGLGRGGLFRGGHQNSSVDLLEKNTTPDYVCMLAALADVRAKGTGPVTSERYHDGVRE
jgi:hypothetical protein